MKKLYLFITALTLIVLLSSCTRVVSGFFGTGVSKAKKLENIEEGKKITYIPMIHAAKPEFYEKIKYYLDSLRSDGYVVYYEGVGKPTSFDYRTDTLRYDTLMRKLRRVIGVHISGYGDKGNKSHKKWWSGGGRIGQTNTNTGIDTTRDINVDYSEDEIIAIYEKDIKEIVLTDYDFNTGLNEKYQSKDTVKHYSFYLIHILRDELIIQKVEELGHDKIVIIYGAGHYWFLVAKLRDLGYTQVKKANEGKRAIKKRSEK